MSHLINQSGTIVQAPRIPFLCDMQELDKNWGFDNSYLGLPSTFYSAVGPTPLSEPEMFLFNNQLAVELGLDFLIKDQEYATQVLSGNHIPNNITPFAQAYGGHQFGYFNVLGDGRAVMIGEILGIDEERYDLQLKGSGQTPYSRRGDGRATLYSMLREYLISEAMHGLGVPTTRSLAVVKSDDPVYRKKVESTGVLTRVASSHIRVGTFELVARMGNPEFIKRLFEYTARRHYPEVLEEENPALSFIKTVIDQQIRLVNDWMRFGFIHGVMNTDNMSIAGETIDYGPCAFMNKFDPQTVFSSIDEGGRYAYANQPKIAKWNLIRLAETLLTQVHENSEEAIKLVQPLFDEFEDRFNEVWKINYLAKLGIILEQDGDEELLSELMSWMEAAQPDFTNTFRGLIDPHLHEDEVFQSPDFVHWKEKWQKRIVSVDRYEHIIEEKNPSVIPRNHLVEEALIEASESENLKAFNDLLEKLQKPFNSYKSAIYQTPPFSDSGYQTFCGT